MLTVSGQRQRCEGVGRVQLHVGGSDTVTVDVYVVSYKPLGFDCILGVNGISALGGMPRHVRDLRSAVLLEANPERAPRHELLGDDDEAPGVAPVRVRPGSVVGNDDGVDIGRGEDAAVDANDDAAVDADDDAAVDADDDAAVDADDDAASLPAARHAAESSNSRAVFSLGQH